MTYQPGIKPFRAACLLVKVRVTRDRLDGYYKAGFTLLEKKGLVEKVRAAGGEIYRPAGHFWDWAEEIGITKDGFFVADDALPRVSSEDPIRKK